MTSFCRFKPSLNDLSWDTLSWLLHVHFFSKIKSTKTKMIISSTLWANLFCLILSNFGRSQSFECSTTTWPPTQWHWNFGNMAWPHCLEMKHFKCIPAKQTIRNTDNVQWDVEKDGAINIKSKYRLNNNWIHVKLIVVFYSIPSTDSRENKYFRHLRIFVCNFSILRLLVWPQKCHDGIIVSIVINGDIMT